MATAGPNQGSAAVQTSDTAIPWVNPENAVSDDDNYATVALNDSLKSDFLDITGFGFSIPDGATVSAIVVEVACKQSVASQAGWYTLRLIKAGSPIGNSVFPDGSAIPTSEEYITSGSKSLATLGTTLSGVEANAVNFGIRLQFTGGVGAGPSTVSVDAVRITLTYSSGSPRSVVVVVS